MSHQPNRIDSLNITIQFSDVGVLTSYSCSFCGYQTTNKHYLLDHEVTEHKDKLTFVTKFDSETFMKPKNYDESFKVQLIEHPHPLNNSEFRNDHEYCDDNLDMTGIKDEDILAEPSLVDWSSTMVNVK